MLKRLPAGIPHRIVSCLACVLCVLTVLVGCAQQPQTAQSSEVKQQATESQANSAKDNASKTESAVNAEEQEAANALAKEYLAEAASHEPEVTQTLQAFEDDTAKLVSLDFRLKSQESLARKILLDAHVEEISLEEAADDIGDILRYTLCIEPPVYVSKATQVLEELEAKGYTVLKFKNSWNSDVYKGINTSLKTPEGQVFELQFHTPDSYKVKEEAHKYYEIARAENATQEEVEEATRMRRELNKTLEIPDGAIEFTWK